MAESAAAAAAAGRKTRVGPYDLGKTIGEGSFAKVKLARDARTGAVCAIKVLDRNHVLRHKMVEQINREISTMKVIKHPNVVQLHEVMASKTNIYMVLEFFDGGELFDKIVNSGRLNEDEARRYFHQFINAVDYCHSRGVYHRDLKPWKLRLARQGSDTEGTSGVQRAGTEGELLRAGAEDDLRREGTEGEHRASGSADVVGKLRRHCKDVRRRLPSFA